MFGYVSVSFLPGKKSRTSFILSGTWMYQGPGAFGAHGCATACGFLAFSLENERVLGEYFYTKILPQRKLLKPPVSRKTKLSLVKD
jgi:hypothetical protein